MDDKKTLIIPEGIAEIKEKTIDFSNRNLIETIEMPDSVTKIDFWAFGMCIALKKIRLSQNLESIGTLAFSGCDSLETIEIPDSVTKIERKAFAECSKLKAIKLPLNLRNLGIFVDPISYYNIPLEKLVIKYKTTEELREFLKYNIKNLSRIMKILPETKLCLLGPTLSYFEIETLKMMYQITPIFITIEEYNEIFQNKKSSEFNIDTYDAYNMDDDIKKIIDRIYEISNKLPEKRKEEIVKQINKLLDVYNSNLEKYKPKFDIEENISLNIYPINTLKPRLLANLNKIKKNILIKDYLIQSLSKLEKYKKLLTEDINEPSYNDYYIEYRNNYNTEITIKNIIYYSKFISEDKKRKCLAKLNEYIDEEIKKTTNKINSNNEEEIAQDIIYDQSNEIIVVSDTLKINILEIYDEISDTADRIFPYIKLLNTLRTKEKIERPKLYDNTLTGLISGIRYIIVNLSNSKYQDELAEKFTGITNKYSIIIEELLKKPNAINQTKYKKLEHNIRENLHLLLELIRNYISLDEYENNTINSTNILNQLYSCKDIIERKEKVTPTKAQNKEVLTSTIIDINNNSLSDPIIDNEKRDIIERRLLNIIDKYINRLNKTTTYNLKKYNLVIREILKEFIDVQLRIKIYIKEVEDYKKYVK